MTSNSCIQSQSSFALPADIFLSVTRAWTGQNSYSGCNPERSIAPDHFCEAIRIAFTSPNMADLDEVRTLLNRGELALGYGRAPAGEGALLKACQASLQSEPFTLRSDFSKASGILTIIKVSKSTEIKLKEVREGLREIWQWGSETSDRIYALAQEESAGESIEVYLFMVREVISDQFEMPQNTRKIVENS